MGFYILPTANDKEELTYQNKRYVQKKREKSICQEVEHTSFLDSGAHIIREEEKNY
jgi:hypothetical protein